MRYDTLMISPVHADALRALLMLEHSLTHVTLGPPTAVLRATLYDVHARTLDALRAEILADASRIMLDTQSGAPLIVIGDPGDPASWRPLPDQTGRAANGLLVVPPQLADHARTLATPIQEDPPCPPT